MLDRVKKLELIQRSLALRHKLKVHDSLKGPETHEDLSVMLMARWELEDELRAIEELLAQDRSENVGRYQGLIEEGVIGKKRSKSVSNKPSSSKKR